MFNIFDEDTNIFNDKLITEHNIEFLNKHYQIDNEFIRLNVTFYDELYKNTINDIITKTTLLSI
jgi:hypothetical protein